LITLRCIKAALLGLGEEVMNGCMRFVYLLLGCVIATLASAAEIDSKAQLVNIPNSNAAQLNHITLENKSTIQFIQPQSNLMNQDYVVFMMMGHFIVNGHIWLIHPAMTLLGAQLRLVSIFVTGLGMTATELGEDHYKAIPLNMHQSLLGDKVAINTQGLIEEDRVIPKKVSMAAAKVMGRSVINLAGVKEASFVAVKGGVIELGSSRTSPVKKIKPKTKTVDIKFILEKTSLAEVLSAILVENKHTIDGGLLQSKVLVKDELDIINPRGLRQMLIVHSPLIFGGLGVQHVNINSALYRPLFVRHAPETLSSFIADLLSDHIPSLEMQFSPEVQIWADLLKVRCELVVRNDMAPDL
jgi:hypothetical protein